MIQNGVLTTIILGNDIENGEVPQVTIPANIWFAARLKNAKGFSLVSITVSPGFNFLDFDLAVREELIRQFPNFKDIIEKFTN